ncbi:MAG: ribose transport system ATP-binding protein [Solirubrobacteraceae bacterium]|nr:ribose transport system ATP-binding protein [Solirubrobacteraceae bacterium]
MLEATGITKSYGGVRALTGAGLTVRAGSVHALLGENGAGKSTLVKIIAGALKPDAGTLRLAGREVAFASTADAVRHGVAVVSQELSLFGDLDVLSNLFPMREPRRGPFVDKAEMAARARPVLAELGLEVSLRRPLGSLSLAQRQLVEVAKALLTQPRVLILDEPTSALEQSSADALMKVLRVLRDRRVAVVFVSHILEEVLALCDAITVLRDGRPVLEGVPRSEVSVSTIVDAMLGERRRGTVPAVTDASAEELAGSVTEMLDVSVGPDDGLRLEGVSVGMRLDDVSLAASPGEIVGLAGIAGAGHATVVELVSGQRRAESGRVLLPGRRPVPRGLRGAIGAGVALVSGDRRRFGLMLDKPLWENIGQVRAIALSGDGPFVRRGRLRARAREHVERLQVRASSVDEHAGQLSGGNQQKVVFAKWLDAQPSVLLLDDPTRGVDVGAKAEMHVLIRGAAAAGAVVLLTSTDIDELAAVCDRVLVFFRGRICAELSSARLSEHAVLEAMNTGGVAASA